MNKIIAMAKQAGFEDYNEYGVVFTCRRADLSRFRNLVLEEALNCYSPDDTAQDWEDKIEALKESK